MLEIDNSSSTSENPLSNENEIINIYEIDSHSNKKFKKYTKILFYFYYVFIHIFIFSLFESFFFWLYITKQEDEAIYKQIEDIILFGELFCKNINDDFDLSPIYDYQKEKRTNYNNALSFNNTIMMNGYLFSVLVFLNILMKLFNTNIVETNLKVLKDQSLIFLLLFLYEYLFFSNVVYNYVPNSVNKLVKKIFEHCI